MGGTRARGDAPSARLAAARAWEGPVVGRRADWTPIGALTSCFLLTHRGQHRALNNTLPKDREAEARKVLLSASVPRRSAR